MPEEKLFCETDAFPKEAMVFIVIPKQISPCVTRFHCFSHGLMVGSSFLRVLQILSRFFPKLSFLKKETKAAHPNANKELISSKQTFAVLYLLVGHYCSLC